MAEPDIGGLVERLQIEARAMEHLPPNFALLREAATVLHGLQADLEAVKGERDDALDRLMGPSGVAEQAAQYGLALQSARAEAARYREKGTKALTHVLGLLETAKQAALFTRPQTGRVIVNVEKLETALNELRAALSPTEEGS